MRVSGGVTIGYALLSLGACASPSASSSSSRLVVSVQTQLSRVRRVPTASTFHSSRCSKTADQCTGSMSVSLLPVVVFSHVPGSAAGNLDAPRVSSYTCTMCLMLRRCELVTDLGAHKGVEYQEAPRSSSAWPARSPNHLRMDDSRVFMWTAVECKCVETLESFCDCHHLFSSCVAQRESFVHRFYVFSWGNRHGVMLTAALLCGS